MHKLGVSGRLDSYKGKTKKRNVRKTVALLMSLFFLFLEALRTRPGLSPTMTRQFCFRASTARWAIAIPVFGSYCQNMNDMKVRTCVRAVTCRTIRVEDDSGPFCRVA